MYKRQDVPLVRQQAGHTIGIARADGYQTTGAANAMGAAVPYRSAGPHSTHLHHLGLESGDISKQLFCRRRIGLGVWIDSVKPHTKAVNAAFMLALQECYFLPLIRQNRGTVIQTRKNIRMTFAQCSKATLKTLGLLRAQGVAPVVRPSEMRHEKLKPQSWQLRQVVIPRHAKPMHARVDV